MRRDRVLRDRQAYRGYLLLTDSPGNEILVMRDGFRIAGAPTVDAAKTIVDMVLASDPPIIRDGYRRRVRGSAP